MLALLKIFIIITLAILALSAFFGVIAFYIDLHNFKDDKQMSLPRAKLIQKIIEQNELERQKKAEQEVEQKESEENENA